MCLIHSTYFVPNMKWSRVEKKPLSSTCLAATGAGATAAGLGEVDGLATGFATAGFLAVGFGAAVAAGFTTARDRPPLRMLPASAGRTGDRTAPAWGA